MNSELRGMHIHLVDYFVSLTPSDDLHLGHEDDKGVWEVGDAACGVGGYLINLKNKLSVVSQACEPPEKSHAPGYKNAIFTAVGDEPGFASGSYKLNTVSQACDTRDKDTRGSWTDGGHDSRARTVRRSLDSTPAPLHDNERGQNGEI